MATQSCIVNFNGLVRDVCNINMKQKWFDVGRLLNFSWWILNEPFPLELFISVQLCIHCARRAAAEHVENFAKYEHAKQVLSGILLK